MTSRRDFLKCAAGAALVQGAGLPALAGAAGQNRPNILIILADDMGFSDIGCYGGEIHTPHLDRLASEGLRFTQFYNAARCCPTRAALLTGLYPHEAGMGRMVSQAGASVKPGAYQGFLNDRCVTIAEALRPAGYKTYMSGKWHVGEEPQHWPRQRGFDRYFGLISGASSYWELLGNSDRKRFMALDDAPYEPVPGDFYMTDAFTDHAVQCIQEHPDGQPFFQYLAYTAPHWPLHAWPEDIAKYRGKYRDGWEKLREQRYHRQLEMGLIDPTWPLSARDEDVPPWSDVDNADDWDQLMAVYAAMVDRMDQGIGRVMAALEARGMADNTLVLFMSDNGGCHEDPSKRGLSEPGTEPGERGNYVGYGRPWAHASNTPFRMFKQYTHEGGIATPLVAHWPKGIPARGDLTHQVAHLVDLMPTCLEVAGAAYPEEHNGNTPKPLAGSSLTPVFQGGQRPEQTFCWEHIESRAIRKGRWKLVAARQEDWELFDVEADRTETSNLINIQPERANALRTEYEAWAERVGVNQMV